MAADEVSDDWRDRPSRGDIALIRRAVVQGWPVPADERPRIVAGLMAVLKDDATPHRVALTVCRLAVRMTAANLEALRREQLRRLRAAGIPVRGRPPTKP